MPINGENIREQTIAKSKKAKEALTASVEKYSALFNSMDEGYFVIDVIFNKENQPVDLFYVEANPASVKIVGSDYSGKRLSEISPNYEKYWFEIFGEVALTGKSVRLERYAEPYKRWYSFFVFKIGGKDSRRIGNTFLDITERKKAEKALQSSEKQKNDILESITDGFVAFDREWRYTYVNSNAARILHTPKEELLGKVAIEVFPNASKFLAEFKKAVSSGAPAHFEEYYPEPLNVWYECHCYPSQDGLTVFFSDINQRKKAETALRQNEQTFLELIERAPFGIYVINSQFRIQHMNKGSQDGAFRNVRPLIGRPFNEAMHILWPDKVAEEILSHFRHTLETGEPYYSPKFINPRHDVEIVEAYEWELQRIRLPDGQYGVICYFFDSTKLRETERVLSEAQAKLKEYASNLEKLVEERTKQLKNSERLAAIGATAGMVGHDIRNPLQAIVSDIFFAKQEIANMPDTETKKTMVETLNEIEENIFYISKIVGDLQDYSRPLNTHIMESNIESIIEYAIANSNIPKNIKTDFKIDSDTNIVLTDPDYLKRIVGNLTINSVQAMPNGGKLTIRVDKAKTAGNTIITVKDTGVGIPDNVKEKLFTPMFTTKSKGQGFGLAVVKRLTEALGGTVTFESEEGKGTKFTIKLPISK